jgi:MFS family permease
MGQQVDDVIEVSAADPELAGRSRIRALTIGSVALISLVAFEALAVATVMPSVAAQLNGLSVYALAFGAPLAFGVVGMALAGTWADDVGARRPLAVGVALFAAGLLLCGSAPQMAVFVAGRGVEGLGGGMISVALYALVGSVVPEPQRPRMFTWFSAAWVLPAMVGPAVSGLILHTLGWRPVFLLVPALAVPATLVMWPVARAAGAPERSADAGPVPDGGQVRRRLLLAAVAGTGAAVLQVAGTRPQPVWRVTAVAALVAVLWCARLLLPEGLFRLARGVPAVVAVRGLIGAAFAGAETYLPLLLVREHRWDPAVAGLVLTLGAVSWSIGSWVQGRYPKPDARYRLSRLGTSLLVVGVSTILVTALPGVPAWIAPIGWATGGCGMGMVYSSTSLLVLHLTPQERHGEASSALTTGESLTTSVVLALGGAMFAMLLPARLAADAPAGRAPYLAGVSVAVLAAAMSVVAAWRMRPSSASAPAPAPAPASTSTSTSTAAPPLAD